ncbi:hypothetical protein QBC44DRAFT_397235, partial [Cladorrhinum sp. PSN332]
QLLRELHGKSERFAARKLSSHFSGPRTFFFSLSLSLHGPASESVKQHHFIGQFQHSTYSHSGPRMLSAHAMANQAQDQSSETRTQKKYHKVHCGACHGWTRKFCARCRVTPYCSRYCAEYDLVERHQYICESFQHCANPANMPARTDGRVLGFLFEPHLPQNTLTLTWVTLSGPRRTHLSSAGILDLSLETLDPLIESGEVEIDTVLHTDDENIRGYRGSKRTSYWMQYFYITPVVQLLPSCELVLRPKPVLPEDNLGDRFRKQDLESNKAIKRFSHRCADKRWKGPVLCLAVKDIEAGQGTSGQPTYTYENVRPLNFLDAIEYFHKGPGNRNGPAEGWDDTPVSPRPEPDPSEVQKPQRVLPEEIAHFERFGSVFPRAK